MELKRYAAYVKSLPNGLESYPHVTQKAHGLRIALGVCGIERKLDLVPPEMRTWIVEPPPPGAWLPEVKVHAMMLLMGDTCFPNDDTAYDVFVYDANRRLLGGPVYSILFRLLGPERICRGASGRWEQMHRNTTLTTLSSSEHACTMVLDTPENLVPPSVARHYSLALRVAFELSGARAVTFETAILGPTRIQYTGRWS